MKIDCTSCEMYRSSHCDDCLVTALLHPPEGEVEIEEDLDEPLGVGDRSNRGIEISLCVGDWRIIRTWSCS